MASCPRPCLDFDHIGQIWEDSNICGLRERRENVVFVSGSRTTVTTSESPDLHVQSVGYTPPALHIVVPPKSGESRPVKEALLCV